MIKKPMHFLFVITLFIIVSAQQGAFNSVRIAYFQTDITRSDGFLQRAKAAGCNFIAAGNGAFPNATSAQYAAMFQTVDVASKGQLKLIPLVGGLGSCHGNTWNQTTDLNSQAGWTATPSWASKTIDNLFTIEITKIRDAFNSSGANAYGTLQFIHLAHDECVWPIYNSDKTLNRIEIVMANGDIGQSNSDASFITTKISTSKDPIVIENAFRILYIDEVNRRVKAVNAISGLQNTQIMIYGDMWDPQINGSLPLRVSNFPSPYTLNGFNLRTQLKVHLAPGGTSTTDLADLPGLSSTDKTSFKQKVVLSPWWYNTMIGEVEYSPANTYKYFKGKGFKITYCVIASGDELPVNFDYINAMGKNVRDSYNYQDCIIGYMLAHFTVMPWDQSKGIFDQLPLYQDFEYMFHFQNQMLSKQ
jgi:hypothetical protein